MIAALCNASRALAGDRPAYAEPSAGPYAERLLRVLRLLLKQPAADAAAVPSLLRLVLLPVRQLLRRLLRHC